MMMNLMNKNNWVISFIDQHSECVFSKYNTLLNKHLYWSWTTFQSTNQIWGTSLQIVSSL